MPALLRKLRRKAVEEGHRPWTERLTLRAWRFVAERPKLYSLAVNFGVRYLRWLAAGEGRIRVLGLAPEWTLGRDFPAPQKTSFRAQLRQRRTQSSS